MVATARETERDGRYRARGNLASLVEETAATAVLDLLRVLRTDRAVPPAGLSDRFNESSRDVVHTRRRSEAGQRDCVITIQRNTT